MEGTLDGLLTKWECEVENISNAQRELQRGGHGMPMPALEGLAQNAVAANPDLLQVIALEEIPRMQVEAGQEEPNVPEEPEGPEEPNVPEEPEGPKEPEEQRQVEQ
ncbi:RNA polymerase II degradation factor 1-like [Drosophila subobscura]|uniref:RNA polymerase II degradation factor 1-like n=1 Tax=Drosophila subobscura TaxID=7241 RepID=UPI00155A8B3A|nr:RNA polymerase II degradation factor 1-like [Drosophila subobscura]